jgi:hypothetical protein
LKKLKLATIAVAIGVISGCGAVNNSLVEKTQTVEYYRIFDIQTDIDRQTIAELASYGLGQNVNSAEESQPLMIGYQAPEKAGQFDLVNPFEGHQLESLMGANSFKMVVCKDATWIAKAKREVVGSDNLDLTACLFPYKNEHAEGYHLNLYAQFSKKTGGLEQISRSMADAMVGTPEEWTEKTFLDIVRKIQDEAGATVSYLEGYPKLQGTPWLDTGSNI